MKFVSTRGSEEISASEALIRGLAPDGGLYVPVEMPRLGDDLDTDNLPKALSAAIRPFFEGDPLESKIDEISEKAFDFPIEFFKTEQNSTMELFHGPTAAFKDFGARFLAFSMEEILKREGRKLTILVATSGDTGGAVASAFHGRSSIDVKVLFPKGRVAERQKKQLTCWGGNVESYEVDGTFDDCQKMVKEAFLDRSLENLSSANSINLGRLLPQTAYYVYASFLYYRENKVKPTIIIPSGNVGNSTGAFWARAMGSPIGKIVLAVNSNTTIPDYLRTGVYTARQSVKTLANAMDVGNPSNMERLFSLFPSYGEFCENVESYSVSDENIKMTIKEEYEENSHAICPHTACAERVRRDYYKDEPTITVSTAHPAKFETIVEPIIGRKIEIPPSLKEILTKPSEYKEISTDYHELFR